MKFPVTFALLCALIVGSVWAQGDVFYRVAGNGIRVWEMLPDQNLSVRAYLTPSVPSEYRFWYVLAVDPRTNELWGVQEDGVNRASFCRLEVQGTQYSIAEEHPLPRHTSTIVAGNFDDDGNWVICANTAHYVTLDLLQRRVVRTTNLPGFGSIHAFTPARRGAPAFVAGSERSSGLPLVAEVDANGAVVRVYARGTSNLPFISCLTTSEGGRVFGCGPFAPVAGFWEFDYFRGVMIPREHLSPTGATGSVLEDPSRGILQIGYHANFSGVSRGIFDLRTSRIVNQLDDRATIYVGWPGGHVGWFPRDRLIASPLRPAAGTSFDAVLSVGGDPGAAGLLWFDRATIGGVSYANLSTVVSSGLLDGRGVFRTVLPYRPGILPLQAGDALFCRGFHWDGAALVSTGEVALRWR
jgi:hypothetical protein